MMHIQHTIPGFQQRLISLDVTAAAAKDSLGVIIFTHGVRGFKDWGYWHLLAQYFAKAGFTFVKYNFSHNGTTPEHLMDFVDLEAFGHNSYDKELYDLRQVVDWVEAQGYSTTIHLLGHSRGGALSIVYAPTDTRVSSLTTWAAVSQLDYAWKDEASLSTWKADGVYTVTNSRTGQQMPQYYHLYLQWLANADAWSTEQAAAALTIPFAIVHGTADVPVPHEQALALKAWQPNAALFLIDGADHVFGGSHPCDENALPKHAALAAGETLSFLLNFCR